MARKRGALSTPEMNFIKQNCFDLSIEEIAKKLGRTERPIKKFIEKENLKARGLSDAEHLLATLRAKFYYQEFKKQFSDEEIVFFENNWIDFFKQFDNVLIFHAYTTM